MMNSKKKDCIIMEYNKSFSHFSKFFKKKAKKNKYCLKQINFSYEYMNYSLYFI